MLQVLYRSESKEREMGKVILLKCTPKVSPHPKHDIHDKTHNQAHLHASPNQHRRQLEMQQRW